jgi:hypothetical protein
MRERTPHTLRHLDPAEEDALTAAQYETTGRALLAFSLVGIGLGLGTLGTPLLQESFLDSTSALCIGLVTGLTGLVLQRQARG